MNNVPMSTTLTIRNLDKEVKGKLELQAASHQRTMEAEAWEILATSLANVSSVELDPEVARAERRRRFEAVVGVWKDEMNGKT
ncbi:MAG: FitA-like ribbon-helix-helix domain-containing protein, partial [Verrucomicrobiales bacterium]